MFWLLFGIVIFLCALHLLLNYNERARTIKKIPGPKDDFLFGNGLEIIQSAVDIMINGRKYAAKWDGIYRIWVYPFGAVIIYNPDDIETVISTTKHGEKSFIYSLLRPWLGDGLLISNGAKWQERRKILTPSFHFNILKGFSEIINENVDRLVENLRKTTGKEIDVVPVLSEFTLNSICETSMGTKLNDDITDAGKIYKNAILNLGSLMFERLVRIYLYVEFIFNLTSWGRAQIKYLKIVHNFTKNVIDQRKEYIEQNGIDIAKEIEIDDDFVYKKKKKTAMLDLLISAEKEGRIDSTGIQEEVDTFMFEGHDTTASGLTFFFMLLANHKIFQDKILQELEEIYPNRESAVKIEDLPKMKYLECCIKESLRIYPPVHFISRNITEDTVLSNYTIPAGTLCHIPILDLHNREDLFKEPTKYDPERFFPENCLGRHPYAFIPFSAGPRNCIGQKFAMMEMKIAVAKVLREFELVPITRPSEIRFKADLVLRNDGPVLVNFVKRL